MNKGIGYEKSRRFALRVVKMHGVLAKRRVPHALSDQILRSGTSVGANLAEAACAVSRADFLSKVYVALKECAETKYWISLLADCGALSAEESKSLFGDCEELFKILMATTKTLVSDKTAKESVKKESVK